MLRWLSRQRISPIALLIAFGLLGSVLDHMPDSPSRLHGRSRTNRAVMCLGVDPHAEAFASSDQSQPLRVHDQFTSILWDLTSLRPPSGERTAVSPAPISDRLPAILLVRGSRAPPLSI